MLPLCQKKEESISPLVFDSTHQKKHNINPELSRSSRFHQNVSTESLPLHRVKATVTRKAHFNSAHRLHVPTWSDEINQTYFGLCNNPNFHGHNYELDVSVTGEINPLTGYAYDIGKLKKLIEKEITEAFDHKNLNLDTPEFKNLNPTAENIASVIWQKLRSQIETEYELTVTLAETPRNIVTVNGK